MITTIAHYNDLRRQLLRVELDLAQSKRAYLVDGVSTRDVRATLEERRAALRLELHDARATVDELKKAADKAKKHQFLLSLIARCEAIGRQDLVQAASAESADWLRTQGMYEAYSAKV